MAQKLSSWTLGGLAALLGGEASGPPDLPLERPVPAGEDDPRGVTFAESDRYLALAESSGVGAVIVGRNMASNKPTIQVDHPRIAFGRLLAISDRPYPAEPGVHATSTISPEATIDPSAWIGPYCVVECGASIGPNCRVFPYTFIGENCNLAEQVTLFPHVTLYRDVSIGARSIVHAGAVIGADGFGYAWDGSRRVKVHQVGRVIIGPDVEIGANTCIDRATCGETIISEGTKIDNLVQVGHNCRIGRHGAIAALTGLSGSVTIGDRVVVGGQVAFADHTHVGDDIALAGRTGIMRDVREAGEYFGTPALPAKEGLRLVSLQMKLPQLVERLKALEAEIERLKGGS
ncbi:MAG TPA: UDP-3-O-(3-hydroxymyristoyl)glucosamine N-acyltransferase [Fimbriimonadaceae bacterium]|nr:UDP-3-O-(3-hydroxymyristoyl)glucosamine N-acyltransferase [Fimbriimonadaceae bacterium]HRJ95461.1 UDP-3-O-(3-hydroxymyristoyl)glucosamine N-acyltransferase [Fimbriimonadaceae bacterium]